MGKGWSNNFKKNCENQGVHLVEVGV